MLTDVLDDLIERSVPESQSDRERNNNKENAEYYKPEFASVRGRSGINPIGPIFLLLVTRSDGGLITEIRDSDGGLITEVRHSDGAAGQIPWLKWIRCRVGIRRRLKGRV